MVHLSFASCVYVCVCSLSSFLGLCGSDEDAWPQINPVFTLYLSAAAKFCWHLTMPKMLLSWKYCFALQKGWFRLAFPGHKHIEDVMIQDKTENWT